jgi:hypothetical protein
LSSSSLGDRKMKGTTSLRKKLERAEAQQWIFYGSGTYLCITNQLQTIDENGCVQNKYRNRYLDLHQLDFRFKNPPIGWSTVR